MAGKPQLETTGKPEHVTLEANIQRQLSAMHLRTEALEAPFTPTPGVFADPQPTTVAEAVNRVAAFVATTHATTIP